MKKVSIIGLSFLSVLTVATVLFFQSCNTDECKDVVCLNGGACVAGACVCDAGYDGTDCDHQIREDYLRVGATATENCVGFDPPDYTVDIVEGTGNDEFRIKNLGNYACAIGDYYVVCTVSTSTDFTISNQTVCSGGLTFTGSGDIDSNGNVTVNYTATYDPGTGTVTDDCTVIISP